MVSGDYCYWHRLKNDSGRSTKDINFNHRSDLKCVDQRRSSKAQLHSKSFHYHPPLVDGLSRNSNIINLQNHLQTLCTQFQRTRRHE